MVPGVFFEQSLVGHPPGPSPGNTEVGRKTPVSEGAQILVGTNRQMALQIQCKEYFDGEEDGLQREEEGTTSQRYVDGRVRERDQGKLLRGGDILAGVLKHD